MSNRCKQYRGEQSAAISYSGCVDIIDSSFKSLKTNAIIQNGHSITLKRVLFQEVDSSSSATSGACLYGSGVFTSTINSVQTIGCKAQSMSSFRITCTDTNVMTQCACVSGEATAGTCTIAFFNGNIEISYYNSTGNRAKGNAAGVYFSPSHPGTGTAFCIIIKDTISARRTLDMVHSDDDTLYVTNSMTNAVVIDNECTKTDSADNHLIFLSTTLEVSNAYFKGNSNHRIAFKYTGFDATFTKCVFVGGAPEGAQVKLARVTTADAPNNVYVKCLVMTRPHELSWRSIRLALTWVSLILFL